MAIAQSNLPPPVSPPMTYEDYMAEGEVNLRYDIIDGIRLVTNPTRRHQHLQGNVYIAFRNYISAFGTGQTVQAPCDVLITYLPLRTRQPDLLLMSDACAGQNLPSDDPAPLTPAPELVVEIISPSDTPSVLNDKIADYQRVNVRECWIVRAAAQTVEVLSLSPTTVVSIAIYQIGQGVQSVVFPDLVVPVNAIFAE